MNNLNDFLSNFSREFQRADRFVCQIIVTPTMVANIILDSLSNDGSALGLIQAGLALENSALAVPQVVKWLAQGYLVSDVRLPDRGFTQAELSMYGITEKFPVHTGYTPLKCTMMMPYAANIENDCAIPRFMSYWQNQVQHATNGPTSGFDFQFPANYYATILLTLLDKQNNGTLTYQFTNAYPSTIDSVAMSWNTPNQFTELGVEFTFSYFTILPVAESIALGLTTQALT